MHTLGMVVWQVRTITTSISFFGFGFGAKLVFFSSKWHHTVDGKNTASPWMVEAPYDIRTVPS
jgi:hypothetical protein